MENNEKMENNETINKKNNIVNTTFCLPITYVDKDKLHEIDHHVMTDLELIHVESDLEKEKEREKEKEKKDNSVIKQKTMYEHVFNPETIYGKRFLEQWAKYYTSDITFLKESQTLIQKCQANHFNHSAESYLDIHDIWSSIQGDKNFKDKFGYIDIAMLDRGLPLLENK